MLKTKSKARLFRIATNNIFFGGASAMVLAKRMQDPEGMSIVSTVYSVSSIQKNPYLSDDCFFCGCDFIPAESKSESCCDNCTDNM